MHTHDHAGRLWRADSLIDLLGRMDPDSLPPEEGRAIGECQAKAVDEWLAAYVALGGARPAREPAGEK